MSAREFGFLFEAEEKDNSDANLWCHCPAPCPECCRTAHYRSFPASDLNLPKQLEGIYDAGRYKAFLKRIEKSDKDNFLDPNCYENGIICVFPALLWRYCSKRGGKQERKILAEENENLNPLGVYWSWARENHPFKGGFGSTSGLTLKVNIQRLKYEKENPNARKIIDELLASIPDNLESTPGAGPNHQRM